MKKLLRNIGLTGILALSAMGVGCLKEDCRYSKEIQILRSELNYEALKKIQLYGDKNKDGIITPEEKEKIYELVAKNNKGQFQKEFNFLHGFKDKEGKRLNGCLTKNNKEYLTQCEPNELRTLIKWFKEYKPTE